MSSPDEGRGSVLVVDDDELMLRSTKRVLELMGYTVETAQGGAHATELLAKQRFDVVVSDISMPGMDGLTLLRKVRATDLDVPVVMVTGQPTLETAVEAIEHGALHYLSKPLDVEALEKTLERGVKLNRMAAIKREALELLGKDAQLAGDRAGLEMSFARALDTLWIAYQPIVWAKDGSLYGYEALLRSNEPSLPHPGAVLDAAERLDRLEDLGRRVRVKAVEPFPVGEASLFVNLHPRDLSDLTLVDPDGPLAQHSGRIVLEITERSSISDIADLRNRVTQLRDLGFRIAVDDLGSGYAGLTSFAQLEPEIVKLDMSIVRDVHTNVTKQKLIGTMTRLCKEMGMLVVAEGVETIEERDLLVELDCDLLQGYLFAKPGPAFPDIHWP